MPAISPIAQPVRQWSVALIATPVSARPDVGISWWWSCAGGLVAISRADRSPPGGYGYEKFIPCRGGASRTPALGGREGRASSRRQRRLRRHLQVHQLRQPARRGL